MNKGNTYSDWGRKSWVEWCDSEGTHEEPQSQE